MRRVVDVPMGTVDMWVEPGWLEMDSRAAYLS